MSGQQKNRRLGDELETVMVGFRSWEWIEKADARDILEAELTGVGHDWF